MGLFFIPTPSVGAGAEIIDITTTPPPQASTPAADVRVA
jgi:hypothetical protein